MGVCKSGLQVLWGAGSQKFVKNNTSPLFPYIFIEVLHKHTFCFYILLCIFIEVFLLYYYIF